MSASDNEQRLRFESLASRHIARNVSPLLTLLDQINSLYDRTTRALAAYPRGGPAAKVGLILTTRLANDLRVCSLVTQPGYGLQALVLAGTVLELVGAIAYVGQDDTRAAAWAQHKDTRHSYPPRVIDGIKATLEILGITDPAVAENWKEAYGFMSGQARESALSMFHALRVDAQGVYHAYGPDASDLGVHFSARALWYAIGFGTFGVMVAAAHCADDTLRQQLDAESRSINERLRGLEPWYLEVIGPESPLKTEKEAAALLSDTHHLRSETARIKRETARIKQGTARLNAETIRLKKATRKLMRVP